MGWNLCRECLLRRSALMLSGTARIYDHIILREGDLNKNKLAIHITNRESKD